MTGFNLGGAINSAADWACSAPIIRSVVSNPVYTALLITAAATIIAMALYHYQIKRAGAKRAARALIYLFLVVAAVTFVHHYAVMRVAQETTQQKGVRDVFSSIQQSRDVGAVGSVPVYPMGYEGDRRATGGAADDDCGCSDAADGGARADNHTRADNVAAAGPDDLNIRDVILPRSTAPFAPR
jgi:hypothetical protein